MRCNESLQYLGGIDIFCASSEVVCEYLDDLVRHLLFDLRLLWHALCILLRIFLFLWYLLDQSILNSTLAGMAAG